MTGCETITAHILEEAKAAAASVLADAQRDADALVAEEKAASAERSATLIAEGEAAAARALENARSAAELTVRSRLLIQRRAEIDAVLEQTLVSLCDRPTEAYFAVILDLADRLAVKGDGVLWLCERDLNRLPADFSEKLNARLGADRQLTVAATPRKMRGGCVLQYGEIEFCAAFDALLEEKREELEDLICRKLFA